MSTPSATPANARDEGLGAPSSEATDLGQLSYEQARDELIDVVSRLEAGGEPLETSLALWERGEALAARCQQWLDGARERLDAARTATSGTAPGPDAQGDDAEDDE